MTPDEEILTDCLYDYYKLWKADRKDKTALMMAHCDLMLECDKYFDRSFWHGWEKE